MQKIINGKKIANETEKKLKNKISNLKEKPKLAVILVGNNPNSKKYVELKKEKCQNIGIGFELHHINTFNKSEIINIIKKLNNKNDVNGILLQLPIPEIENVEHIFNEINYLKDVDGITSLNIGNRILNVQPYLIPCTAKGIVKVLDYYNIDLVGKNIVVIGSSHIVGYPIAREMIANKATVTICDINTTDLKKHTINADVIISATGSKHLIKENMIQKNVILIDVGITKEKESIYGDVDFDNAYEKSQFISKHPGGIGPMTVISLMENVYLAYLNQKDIK